LSTADIELNTVEQQAIRVSFEQIENGTTYTAQGFPNGYSARNVLEYSMIDAAKADRELVKAKLAEGVSLEDAVADMVSDEHFTEWYQATKGQLEELCK